MPIPSNNPQQAAELRNKAEVQGKVGLSVDEIVVPVTQVGQDFPELPWNGVGGGFCWGGITSPQPDPGENAWVWLHNPTGSGVVARVELLSLNLEAGALPVQQTVAFGVTQAFAGPTAGAYRIADLRRDNAIGGQNTVLEIHEASQPGLFVNPQRLVTLFSAANEGDRYDFSTRIVLIPGSSVAVASQQVDRAVSVWFQWDERVVRAAERVLT